jgi:hypothetical protein
MVQNVLDKAPDILNAINPTVITGAKVEFVDVGNGDNSERKCILRIFVVTAAPKETSSISITELYEPDDPMLLDSATSQANLNTNTFGSINLKAKATVTIHPTPTDESSVHHSKRIVVINVGYKNATAKEKAENKEPQLSKKNKKGKNKTSDYTAMIIDEAAHHHLSCLYAPFRPLPQKDGKSLLVM